jgi:hypothetical protein
MKLIVKLKDNSPPLDHIFPSRATQPWAPDSSELISEIKEIAPTNALKIKEDWDQISIKGKSSLVRMIHIHLNTKRDPFGTKHSLKYEIIRLSGFFMDTIYLPWTKYINHTRI